MLTMMKLIGAPKHGRLQQHDIVSGLAGQVWLGDQLDNGWLTAKRGIDRFTEDGNGAIFSTFTPFYSIFLQISSIFLYFPSSLRPIFTNCASLPLYSAAFAPFCSIFL